MSFKSILFSVVVILLVSCGSTKKVDSDPKTSSSETKAKSIINVQLEPKVQNDESKHPETSIDTSNSKREEIILEDQSLTIDHSTWNNLLQQHVSPTGNVDYEGFKSDRTTFYTYLENLQNNPPQQNWNREQVLAYWINAYNAFTIDLILRNYPLQSIKDIKDPWDQRLWNMGSKWYNLNDIEHQILRKMDEPRIHFAIVCASVSCPKLQNSAFRASDLETQLTAATKGFLLDDSKNNISETNLKLSKIFKWFSKDFKQNGSLIDFLNQYTEVKISERAKKSYLDYNWDLND